MKKIRITVLALMFVLMVTALAGCGRKDGNKNNSSATQSTTQAATQAPVKPGNDASEEQTGESQKTTEDERGGSVTGTEESTGVIGGLIDDVESGADRLTDDLTGQDGETRNTDESAGR